MVVQPVSQLITTDTMLNSNGQKIGDGLNFVTCLLAIILIFCKALESILYNKAYKLQSFKKSTSRTQAKNIKLGTKPEKVWEFGE